ncbi:MAG: hypothetical protein KatS3mg002_1447 [Candidatus Woesearchaeota archaeon]|nr:MAG: hypothetical protein KatS3mg002_1447 [Candidatus Woesearchaeota archaeon]
MLKIRYISQANLNNLNTQAKINLLLHHIRNNDIIITEGRLKSKDEAELIRRTMTELHNNFEIFNGIEIASIQNKIPEKKAFNKIFNIFNNEPKGITIIGPASIISEMRQEQEYVELHLNKKNIK